MVLMGAASAVRKRFCLGADADLLLVLIQRNLSLGPLSIPVVFDALQLGMKSFHSA